MDQQVTADDGIQDAAFTVAGWSVDLSTLRIQKQDKDVKLEPKVMAVLEYLVSRSGQVVSRQDLEQAVWTGTVVGYDAISNAIIKLRKAFGDDAQHPQIIETIPKTGYRLIAAVEVQPGTDLPSPDSNVISESSQAASSEAATVQPPRPASLSVPRCCWYCLPWCRSCSSPGCQKLNRPRSIAWRFPCRTNPRSPFYLSPT
jgi:DNA-binding winged helix-turn-helix (wHTH) protein